MTQRRDGEWIDHGVVETVYESWWVSLTLDDVERPDGSRVRHEVIRGPDSAGMVVVSPTLGMLLIWRHRFMPDTWGWEIPAGAIDAGESPMSAAVRECHEETGWRVVGDVSHLSTHHPTCGLVNQTFHLFLTTEAEFDGAPTDVNEAARVEWRALADVAADLRSGAISDGFTSLAVALALGATGNGDLLTRPDIAGPHGDD